MSRLSEEELRDEEASHKGPRRSCSCPSYLPLLTAYREVVVALERITEVQPKVVGYIRREGFVFEDIGTERGNWQHLAFSIYSDLCEVDALARQALSPDPKEEG